MQALHGFVVFEVNPGHGGLVYDVIDLTTGSGLATVVVSSATASFSGLAPNRMWWNSLPNQSLKFNSSSTTPITISGGTTYATQAFPTSKTTAPTVTSGGWTVTFGSQNSGFMYRDTSSNLIFALSTTVPLGVGTTFVWSSTLGTPSGTWYVITDTKL